jgi:hypothetical protein
MYRIERRFPTTTDEVGKYAQEEWNKMTPDDFNHYCSGECMRMRCRAVIAANGGHWFKSIRTVAIKYVDIAPWPMGIRGKTEKGTGILGSFGSMVCGSIYCTFGSPSFGTGRTDRRRHIRDFKLSLLVVIKGPILFPCLNFCACDW